MTSPHPSTSSASASASEEAPILKQDRLGRVHLSPERRDELLALYDASAMSAPLFADWAGIKYQTLARWLLKRRKASAGSDTHTEAVSNSVPLHAPPKISWVEARLASPSRSGHTESEPSGLVLHLPGGARVCAGDARTMAELLQALGVGIC